MTLPIRRSWRNWWKQTDETPNISFAEKIIEKPVTQTQGNTQQVVNTRVQHAVPLLQFTDKVVDIPVVAQRQIRVNWNVQKTTEISQLQYTDDAVDVPVVLVVLVPQVQVVAETAEIPQLQVVGKIGEILEDFPVNIPVGRAKFSRFLKKPSPSTIFFLSFLSWVSSRGILVVFLKRRDPQMCTFEVLGLSCHESDFSCHCHF